MPDNTEAIALRMSADAANAAKSDFLSRMSHELRTPLNAIGGYVDLIDLEVHGPVTEEQRVDLARIRSNQRYLVHLIGDLLDFAKLGSGQAEYHVTDIVVRDAIAVSITIVEPLIAAKRLVLKDIVCDPDIIARGDRERVIQVLVNLLSNGIKFTPLGGELDLACETSGAHVRIRLTDTGIGIPEDKLESIFEPFVQISRAVTQTAGGVGLGLAISRTLARGMDGDLTVESQLHAGARFTLRLPRAYT